LAVDQQGWYYSQMSQVKDEIEHLLAFDKELAVADAEFEHQQRRYGERIERGGGSDWGFADDLRQIAINRKSIAEERGKIAARLARLQNLGGR